MAYILYIVGHTPLLMLNKPMRKSMNLAQPICEMNVIYNNQYNDLNILNGLNRFYMKPIKWLGMRN